MAGAPTSQNGLRFLEAGPFGAIVSDIALPDGTGYALVGEAKRRWKGTPPNSKDVPKTRMAKLKRFMARPTFEDELELHRVDCESSHRILGNYELLLRKREEFTNEPIIPPPLVRWDDLIALSLTPGPKFGEILEAVETRQLDDALNARQAALEWVKREYLSSRSTLDPSIPLQILTPRGLV